jgi:hypothetical protein
MRKLALLLSAACLAGLAGPAAAQATRTWVSGVGDDANPCSRTAPCKTFAGAISKTAAAGEISVLDPGGFGGVTITKSISIVADGSEGGILAAGTTGILVNAGANDIVNIRGLVIEGAGSCFNGIRFFAGGVLHVQDTVIRGCRGTTAGAHNGIVIANASGTPEIDITDVLIEDNGGVVGAAGVLIKPTGTGGAKVTMTRVQTLNNQIGVSIDGDLATGPITAVIQDSTISGNAQQGLVSVSPNGTDSLVTVQVSSSTASGNGGNGMQSAGQRSTVRVGSSTASGNGGVGLQANNSGVLQSYGDNYTDGNTGGANVGVTPATPG